MSDTFEEYPNQKYQGLIFDRRTDGHRNEYLTYFSRVLGCEYSHNIHRLIGQQLIVFSTLEGNALIALFWSMLNAIMGHRATIVAYWLIPHVKNTGLKQILKYGYVRIMSAVGVVFLSPIKKRHIPRPLQRFIHWYPDPQAFDLYRFHELPNEKSSRCVHEHTSINMIMMGIINTSKNPNLFIKIVTQCVGIVGVVVGRKQKGLDIGDDPRITIVDRRVTREEMIQYLVDADIVFALYTKDQSSGVAGRAVQLSKPVLVWEESILAYHLPKNGYVAIDRSASVEEICNSIHQALRNECCNLWVLSRYVRYATAVERVIIDSVM